MSEKTTTDLNLDQAEVKMLRNRLVAEKMALQGLLADINAKCRIRLPQHEFHKLQTDRAKIVRQVNDKEQEIAALNASNTGIHAVLESKKNNEFGHYDIRKLVEIRDLWHGFSMEPGNHQKAREAAWKFSQELRAVLKDYFDRGERG